jgi:hypothetical protein
MAVTLLFPYFTLHLANATQIFTSVVTLSFKIAVVPDLGSSTHWNLRFSLSLI